ncbi:PilN domain-containing protein [Pantoea sp. LMR881]|uniref:PilN domain-containing protein n=1 Tax=Pantoea sp. LMR881 TaxID=3014336 RepID=UPI0022AF76F8|nr:PilN domain-containing protein [Pantoea sp. LMR881]MCZ4059963.1 PilN domain-containing protein [Pantoea sp. LMR881]
MVAVNLLPWREHRWQRQRQHTIRLSVLLAGSIVLTVACQAWQIQQAKQHVMQQQATLTQALNAIAQRLALQKNALEALSQQRSRLEKQQREAEQFAHWQQFWLDLPGLLPDALWLQRIEKQDLQLRIEGQAQDMQAIGHFRQQLALQPLFTQVRQGNVKRQAEGSYHFSLRAQLQEQPNE